MIRTMLALGAALAATVATAAPLVVGTPVSTPLNLTGNGNPASAIFAYQDAGDTSNLNLIVPAFGLVFNNQTATPGDVINVGSPNGPVTFELQNISTGVSFLNNSPDSDGNYHFFASTNYADFGVGAIDPAVQALISAFPVGEQFIFVGAEDRTAGQGSDFDYNDIIYVFTQIRAVDTPEASSIALFGMGVLGLALARRRRG